ncbi:hypothetical protein [Bacteroides sp. 224]|uniref:hypothetical protein n=1 Tax=Bacteroides sp. 224 TaxID=2302936 RepID=UPI0013D2F43C|nr:hypothetical protein [Bacteroides sp. 224]NDV64139.1 hypothetical protein [Bacteroides sp. 224]
MKDTLITARRKKIELITLLICFVIANLVHLYAIVTYRASFTELITSAFYIILFTFVLYGFWSVVRILFYGVKGLIKSKKSRA